MTPAACKRAISTRQFATLWADYQIEPWGPERADARFEALIGWMGAFHKVAVDPAVIARHVNPWKEAGTPDPKAVREKIKRFNAGLRRR